MTCFFWRCSWPFWWAFTTAERYGHRGFSRYIFLIKLFNAILASLLKRIRVYWNVRSNNTNPQCKMSVKIFIINNIEGHLKVMLIWAAKWQNQQNECVPSEDSDQPGHPPSLIRVFTVRMKKPWVLSYPLRAQQRLWSDWADAQADLSLPWVHILFVSFVMLRLIWNSNYLFPCVRRQLQKFIVTKLTTIDNVWKLIALNIMQFT